MRKFHNADFPQSFTRETHGPFLPSPVRFGENISYTSTDESFLSDKAKIWRISPLGIEFYFTRDPNLQIGKTFTVNLRMGKQLITVPLVVATPTFEEEGRKIVGCHNLVAGQADQATAWTKHRNDPRYLTHRTFVPTGVARSEEQFENIIYFQVIDFSRNGLRLKTSVRNNRLLLGLKVRAKIQLPTIGSCRMNLVIKNLKVVESKESVELLVGTEFLEHTSQMKSLIGQYLLEFGRANQNEELTPGAIKRLGYTVMSISDAVDFSYVQNQKEYEEVLSLRHRAYSSAGRLDQTVPVSSLADQFDKRARIIIGRHRGKIIATSRVVFPRPGEDFEQSHYTTLPSWFPASHLCAEISRASTHEDYRGSDLFLGLLRYSTLTVVQSKRKHILLCAHEDLARLYTRIGFTDTKIRIKHKVFKEETHLVFLGDASRFVQGAGNPLVWLRFFDGMLDLITPSTFHEANLVDKGRVFLFRQALKAAKLFRKNRF